MFENALIQKETSIHIIPKPAITYLDEKIKIYRKLQNSDLSEKIGVLSGYELVNCDEFIGGYCDYYNKEIAIIEKTEPIILHELCHAFQIDMGILNESNLLSNELKFEQQCESMARYMYEKLYKTSGKNIFTAYFKEQDIVFLKKWYKGYREVDI